MVEPKLHTTFPSRSGQKLGDLEIILNYLKISVAYPYPTTKSIQPVFIVVQKEQKQEWRSQLSKYAGEIHSDLQIPFCWTHITSPPYPFHKRMTPSSLCVIWLPLNCTTGGFIQSHLTVWLWETTSLHQNPTLTRRGLDAVSAVSHTLTAAALPSQEVSSIVTSA